MYIVYNCISSFELYKEDEMKVFLLVLVVALTGCATEEYECVSDCVGGGQSKPRVINPGVDAARARGAADRAALEQARAEFEAYCKGNPYGSRCQYSFINSYNRGDYQPPGGNPVGSYQTWGSVNSGSLFTNSPGIQWTQH